LLLERVRNKQWLLDLVQRQEYSAMAHTTSELTCFWHFLQEIGFSVPTPIPLYCDNQAAVHITSNPVCSMSEQNTLNLIDISFGIKNIHWSYFYTFCKIWRSTCGCVYQVSMSWLIRIYLFQVGLI
jgi:uncharacterized protein YybS (DUF2232 family)